MAKRISTRLTAAEGRKFGLTVGLAFLVIASLTWWRGHTIAPAIAGTLGAALVAGGLIVPTRLGPVERGWMALAHAISRVTTPIVMAIMYFVVITPTGILRRTLSRNPLKQVEQGSGFWQSRPAGARRTGSMQRQF